MKKTLIASVILSGVLLYPVNGNAEGAGGVEPSTATVKYAVEGTTITEKAVLESTPTVKYIFDIDIGFNAGITIEVYDKDNVPVKSVEGYSIRAGTNSYSWDGKDNSSKPLKDGLYHYDMYALEAAEKTIIMISGKFEVITDTTVVEPCRIKCAFRESYEIVDESAYKINRVEIKGNTRTKAGYILNKFNIKKRSFYNEEEVSDMIKSLKRSFFVEVVEYEIVPGARALDAVLRVKLREKKLNAFKLRGGYDPLPDGTCPGYLPAAVDFKSRNISDGVYREVNLSMERPHYNRRVYDIDYLESIGKGFFEINYHEEDETVNRGSYSEYDYSRVGVGVSLVKPVGKTIDGTLGYCAERVAVNNVFAADPSSKNKFIIKLDNSRSKRCEYLEEEFFDSISLEVGLERNDSSRNITKLRMSKGISVFPKEDATLELRGGSGMIFCGGGVEGYESFRLGGIKNIRGLNEDSVSCMSFIYGSAEARFRLRRNSFFCIFCDAGAWSETSGIPLEQGVIGYGLGIKIHGNNWLFDLSVASNSSENISDIRALSSLGLRF